MSAPCYNKDFGDYVPLNRDSNNGCCGLIGNTGVGRGGHGYRGYNGAYWGVGNRGGGWPHSNYPSFIPYNSFGDCERCGYCLDDNTRFG